MFKREYFKRNIVSLSVLAALSMSSAAVAQEQQDESSEQEKQKQEVAETIEVTGVRSSMSEALLRKQESIQLVDSIVAEDIGKLPNNNVVEALQQVSGIQVGTRSNGEASSVLIRGLNQVVTTINGRNAFTGASRSYALADIPATMVAGIDVYKSASAEMVDGGIGGVINVRTRRPFDFDGGKVSFTGKGTYSDQSEETDPNVSLLMSDRWDTDMGDFGALVNLAYAETNFRDETIWSGASFAYSDQGQRLDYPPGEELSTDSDEYVLLRDSIGGVDGFGKRERPAVSVSLQWAPDNDTEYYFDGFYTGYRNQRNSSFLFVRTDAMPLVEPFEYFEGTNVVKRSHTQNAFMLTSSQGFKDETDSYQYALGVNWIISDKLKLSSELSYQLSELNGMSQILDTSTTASELIVDFNPGGSGTPSMNIIGTDITDTSNFVAGTYFDGVSESRGEATSLRFDGNYYSNWGIVESVDFGMRYDVRKATSDSIQTNTCCTNLPVDNFDGLMGQTPGDFFTGKATYPHQWATADVGFMLANRDYMRENFANYEGVPAYDPTLHFNIDEKSAALYGQANIYKELGLQSIDGIFGIRVVRTESTLEGYETTTANGETTSVLREYDNSSTEVLPNLTLRYNVTDKFRFRFNASKTISRPAFNDLNPAITLQPPIQGQVQVGLASSGNADLKPIESLNFDFGAEYYWGESSAVYGTLFYRDVDNWIETTTVNETYDGVVYNLTQPTNTGSAEMKGLELGLTYFPEELPGWLQGIGVKTSYTYIDAATEQEDGSEQPMFNVSENSLSATLVYERGPFTASLSHVYRDDYLTGFNYTANMPAQIMVAPLEFTDFSMSYDLTEQLVVTLDATNIFGEEYQDYFGNQELFNRDTRSYSKTYSLGVRYSF